MWQNSSINDNEVAESVAYFITIIILINTRYRYGLLYEFLRHIIQFRIQTADDKVE